MKKDLTNMGFEIIPFVGVGELRFGMTPTEIADILGVPLSKDVGRNYYEERVEYRSCADVVVSYDKNSNTAAEFGFGQTIRELSYMKQKIFLMPELDALRLLIDRDSNPYESVGFVIFPNLGISMTGFHDNDPDEKAVSVSEKGRLDRILTRIKNIKPFNLP
jgi:hypothetical protein